MNKTLFKVAFPCFLLTIIGIILIANDLSNPKVKMEEPTPAPAPEPAPVVPPVSNQIPFFTNKIIFSNADATNYKFYVENDNILYVENLTDEIVEILFDNSPVSKLATLDDEDTKLYLIANDGSLYISNKPLNMFSFGSDFSFSISAVNVVSLKYIDDVLYYVDIFGNERIVNDL